MVELRSVVAVRLERIDGSCGLGHADDAKVIDAVSTGERTLPVVRNPADSA
jgi:hypothetical protein